ncbi:MAG TPA: ABC transporter permease [Solirubrobacteraceae bacterium]|nr:ABC transporter permease [Solirubrobacteraceae bacterium]
MGFPPVLAAAAGGGPDCPPGPKAGAIDFGEAVDFIFNKRQSVGGTVCVGGPGEIVDLAVNHLVISFIAVAVGIAIALPLGLWLGHIGRFEFIATSISNVGRAVPTLALLAFFVAFLGKGELNVIVVLALLAIPPILTNTYVGVRQVSPDAVDAARGQGMTGLQILRQVELPLAMATIFAGIRTAAVAVVATATIAPLANVETLGTPIIVPQQYAIAGQLGAAIVVAVITLLTDALLGLAQRAVTPRGIRAVTPTPRIVRIPFLQRRAQTT